MKKILLLAAFGLLASPAFAQSSTADVDQTGNNNDSQVDQVGSMLDAKIDTDGNNNDAYIDQTSATSDALEADIRQLGNTNYASIDQSTEMLIMDSDIQQFGDRNRATVDFSSTSTTQVSGSGSTSFQLQQGNDNRASIEGTSMIFDMTVDQRQNGDRNRADAVGTWNAEIRQAQTGNDNVADAEVIGKNSVSQQTQVGDDNRALISSGPNAADTGALSLLQIQSGDDNLARFDGTGASADATSRQYGDQNQAIVSWENRSWDTTADIYQDGNRNDARISFVADGNSFPADNNSGVIRQVGNDNDGRITFTHTQGNIADINQAGNGNNSVINQ